MGSSAGTCPRCKGFVVTIQECASCINCGWYGYIQHNAESSNRPAPSEPSSKTRTYCKSDSKHGRVSVVAHIGEAYKISLSGQRSAFFRWGSLRRSTVENRLFRLLLDPPHLRAQRVTELRVSAPQRTISFLKQLRPMKVKCFLGNTFAYPFAHGYLRDRPRRGASSDEMRILFWQTARDIGNPLNCWLDSRGRSDVVYAKLHRLLLKECGRVTDDLILRYLIDLNWRNAGRPFPDGPALENRQTSRYLSRNDNVHFSMEYVHSAGWMSDDKTPDMFSAIGKGRNALPPSQGGRILAQALMEGRYIVRSRNFVEVSLHPSF